MPASRIFEVVRGKTATTRTNTAQTSHPRERVLQSKRPQSNSSLFFLSVAQHDHPLHHRDQHQTQPFLHQGQISAAVLDKHPTGGAKPGHHHQYKTVAQINNRKDLFTGQIQYASPLLKPGPGLREADTFTEDGKVLDLDCENMGIKRLVEECDRHSRALQKQADLADG